LEPLSEAKKAGLKLALHLSEVKVFIILVPFCKNLEEAGSNFCGL